MIDRQTDNSSIIHNRSSALFHKILMTPYTDLQCRQKDNREEPTQGVLHATFSNFNKLNNRATKASGAKEALLINYIKLTKRVPSA